MDPMLYRKRARTTYCLGIIAAALLLRLSAVPGMWSRAGQQALRLLSSRRTFETALFLEGGGLRAVSAGTERPSGATSAAVLEQGNPRDQTVPSTQTETEAAETNGPAPDSSDSQTEPEASDTGNPAETEAELRSSAPAFRPEEAEGIELRGNCTYEADKTALLLRPLDWSSLPGPKVLIIHTHSCEAYTPSEGHAYEEDGGAYRTLDRSASVVAVGDVLAQALEELGVEVIHDRTYNDDPSYNASYAVAREKIQTYVEQYPSLVMVIDLHRDAMDPPVRETAAMDGHAAALMLVIGTDEGGLSHPHWQDNLSCGLKLQALANRAQPGLFKPISFRKERFNGDLTSGSLIVEVGSTGNTLPEAFAAMPYLAEDIRELLELSLTREP